MTQNQVGAEYSSASMADLKREIHCRLLDFLDIRRRNLIKDMSDSQLRDEATVAVDNLLDQSFPELGGTAQKELIKKSVVAEAVGLGALEPYLDDPDVSEIMVNGAQKIYLEKHGKIVEGVDAFSSNRVLHSIIERIVSPVGRRIDESSPMVDARLSDGSRVNAIIPPLALNGPVITIRKFSRDKLSMDDLVNKDALSAKMGQFLETCVRLRKNVIISGGTGSGKTTLLNILSGYIGADERIITIEDAAELQLAQEHVVRLESRPCNSEGKGEVAIRDLVRNALRMRPDRIVVGECRGGEALDMLQAMNTGHDGSMTTGHANSPRDFLSRLEVMVMLSGVDLPSRAIREQIASAVDIIIQISRFSDGSRKVVQIVEVAGMENDTLLLQPLFEFVREGVDASGKIAGYHRGLGYAPQFYEKAREAGLHLDMTLFENEAGLLHSMNKGSLWS